MALGIEWRYTRPRDGRPLPRLHPRALPPAAQLRAAPGATVAKEGANPLCGDRITIELGIRNGVVDQVGFTGRGCAISQASASLLTDEIKGKTVEQVAAYRADDLLDLLGIDISPARLKCAMLSLETVTGAIAELEPKPAGAADA